MRLVIPALVAITGLVHPDATRLEIGISDGKQLRRAETFYRTGGTFALRDLPAGHYTLTASSDTSNASRSRPHRRADVVARPIKNFVRCVDLNRGR